MSEIKIEKMQELWAKAKQGDRDDLLKALDYFLLPFHSALEENRELACYLPRWAEFFSECVPLAEKNTENLARDFVVTLIRFFPAELVHTVVLEYLGSHPMQATYVGYWIDQYPELKNNAAIKTVRQLYSFVQDLQNPKCDLATVITGIAGLIDPSMQESLAAVIHSALYDRVLSWYPQSIPAEASASATLQNLETWFPALCPLTPEPLFVRMPEYDHDEGTPFFRHEDGVPPDA